MEKRPLVIGNWKMELSYKGEIELVRALKDLLKNISTRSEIVVCPSAASLEAVKRELSRSKKVALGAQNVFWEKPGAWTGQVSITHIQPFVSWCLIGHSEVREVLRPREEDVAALAPQLLAAKIQPVVCIGETQQERRQDKTADKIRYQVDTLLQGLDRSALAQAVIAYEPIWAIGTGIRPEPDDVAEVVLLIRKHIAKRHDRALADRVRILYGGSVKAGLAARYVSGPLADGLLVGGASVHPKEFVDIILEAGNAYSKS